MGRKRMFKNSGDRVRSWRQKHKVPVVIKLDSPLGMVCKKYWEQDGVTIEQGIRAYELFKRMYKDAGIDRLRDKDFKHLPNIELVDGIWSDYIEGTVYLSVLECPRCHKRFPWLENVCPRCNRQIKIIEIGDNNGNLREEMSRV